MKRPSSSKRQTAGDRVVVLDPALRQRVVVEGVEPEVDAGRFPIKRTPGEPVIVEADVFADGHDVIAAALLWRAQGDTDWNLAPMEPIGNDRWRAQFVVEDIRPYEYTVEGWIDRFESWRLDLSKKAGAGQEVANELLEGAAIARDAASRAKGGDRTE